MKRCEFIILALVLMLGAVAARAAGEDTILVLGDSLSAGYGIALDEGWVSLLEHRLQAQGPSYRVVNASISGETTAGGRARLPELLERHQPAIVVLELGANDGLRGQPVEAMRDNLEQMVRLVRRSGAQVVLLGMEIPVNYGSAYRDRFRAVYQDLAKAHGLAWTPFFLEGVALRPEWMQDDGLHPNTAGQPRVLENVWEVLAPLLNDVETASAGAAA